MTAPSCSFMRITILSGIITSSMGCVTPALARSTRGQKSREQAADASTTGIPRVADGWQKKWVEQLESEKFDEGWALFSEGGWSDTGQVMLLGTQDKSRFLLLVSTPNARAKAEERPFAKSQWDTLAPVIERAVELSDVDEPMFDGLIYEYVHLKRDSQGQLKQAKRLYIKATGRIPHKDHDALIKALQGLQDNTSR